MPAARGTCFSIAAAPGAPRPSRGAAPGRGECGASKPRGAARSERFKPRSAKSYYSSGFRLSPTWSVRANRSHCRLWKWACGAGQTACPSPAHSPSPSPAHSTSLSPAQPVPTPVPAPAPQSLSQPCTAFANAAQPLPAPHSFSQPRTACPSPSLSQPQPQPQPRTAFPSPAQPVPAPACPSPSLSRQPPEFYPSTEGAAPGCFGKQRRNSGRRSRMCVLEYSGLPKSFSSSALWCPEVDSSLEMMPSLTFLKILPLFAKKKSIYGRAIWISKTARYNEHWNKLSPWDEKNSTTPSSSHSTVNKTQESLTLMLPRIAHSLEEGKGMERLSAIQVPCYNIFFFVVFFFFNRGTGVFILSSRIYHWVSRRCYFFD